MDRIECLAEDNRCPECGSKRIYRPSNMLLASRYLGSQFDAQCWNYECSKCGWRSELFAQ